MEGESITEMLRREALDAEERSEAERAVLREEFDRG